METDRDNIHTSESRGLADRGHVLQGQTVRQKRDKSLPSQDWCLCETVGERLAKIVNLGWEVKGGRYAPRTAAGPKGAVGQGFTQ